MPAVLDLGQEKRKRVLKFKMKSEMHPKLLNQGAYKLTERKITTGWFWHHQTRHIALE